MFNFFAFVFLLIFLIQGCSTREYSRSSYKKIVSKSNETCKSYPLDLTSIYNLLEAEKTSCIFSKKVGLFLNNKGYTKKYLQGYKKKSDFNPSGVTSKVKKITELLIKLQKKHNFLNRKHYESIQLISNINSTKVNPNIMLIALDKITSNIPLMLPSYNSYVSSKYGIRKQRYGKKKYKMHCGIDLVAKHQAPIFATANGVVSFVGYQKGYGITIDINHENNIKTKYTHLKKTFVKIGQTVPRGQIIALQGKSGNAHGSHLHFEIHIGGKHINPYDFIGHNYEC